MKLITRLFARERLQHVANYLMLIRWPNLLVTVFTMVMVRYYLIRPLLMSEGYEMPIPLWVFLMLVLSVLLMMSGGYVINDYFDVRIDQVNRVEKVVLGSRVPVRHAIPLHATLTSLGVLTGLLVSLYVGTAKLVFVHLIVGLMLWLYSARYKRRPFWGNLVVAVLSGLVVLVVWLFEFMAMANQGIFIMNRAEFGWVNNAVFFFAAFAFVLSLIREIIKDMADVEGDKRYGCLTLPVVAGMTTVKWIVTSITLVTMLALLGVQIYLWLGSFYKLTAYYFIVVQIMLALVIQRNHAARKQDDYHFTSQLLRIAMVAGVLSLQIYHIE